MIVESPKSWLAAVVTAVLASVGVTWAIAHAFHGSVDADIRTVRGQVGELRQRVSRLEWQCGRLRGAMGLESMEGLDLGQFDQESRPSVD